MITYYEITIDGSTDTVGDNNWFRTENEAREAIPSLQALGDDWAEGNYNVRETEADDDWYDRHFPVETNEQIIESFSTFLNAEWKVEDGTLWILSDDWRNFGYVGDAARVRAVFSEFVK